MSFGAPFAWGCRRGVRAPSGGARTKLAARASKQRGENVNIDEVTIVGEAAGWPARQTERVNINVKWPLRAPCCELARAEAGGRAKD